jgi:predicted XRE-type DNA-binding protein
MPRETTVRGRKKMEHIKKRSRLVSAAIRNSSGNVFADLGLPNPAQELLKAQLVLKIHSVLKDSAMTQVEIAKILGVRQPQVSLLMRNRAGNFSVGRLMEFLTALRQDVQITVRPTRKERGALSVVGA